MNALKELTKEAAALLSTNLSCDNHSQKIEQVAANMISAWTAIARAYLRGGLSESDLRIVQSLGKSCIPVRRVLESHGNGGWIVSIDRCVRMPDTSDHADSNKDKLKRLSVTSLVASNFMCDFNHSNHNPFFSQPDISQAITVDLLKIPNIRDVRTDALIRASGSFVRYCCQVEPIISSRLSPIRSSFSYAMRCCIESPRELTKIDGGLKMWVRSGPGFGTKALRRRWVSLNNGPVKVVLDDSRVCSALLTPEMGLQLLGVLNHAEYEKVQDSRTLSMCDKEVVKYLGILRLSDKRFTVKTRTRGIGEIIKGASHKIQLVCALLKSMEIHEGSAEPSNDFLTSSYDPPLIIRHDSLRREFQAPGMSAPKLVCCFWSSNDTKEMHSSFWRGRRLLC